MGILIQTTSLVYVFPSALSLGVSTRIGNELGANRPGRARVSTVVSMSCAAMLGIAANDVHDADEAQVGEVFHER